MKKFSEKVSFIWSVADILRHVYRPSEYAKVILPFTVLRRLDQVLAPTRKAVRDAAAAFADRPEALREHALLKAGAQSFYNTSSLDFPTILGDPENIAKNLVGYLNGFSPNARDIVEHFRFETEIERLSQANLLFLIVQKFAAIDLHPDRVSNLEMGYIFEELIRKFSEQSNETAGEHFTPREVIRLMVNLLFVEDDAALRTKGVVRTMYDPACGTGGMLSVAQEYLAELNPDARLEVFGQEINDESYAICKSDMMVKGQQSANIKVGNSFSEDHLRDLKADYLISNPPYGVDWTKAQAAVVDEYEKRGHAGRFGPGLPAKDDGSLLFLLHMMSKMKPVEQGGSRLAIVFSASTLFSGSAESGESEIRRFLLENDMLEAVIGLPDQMFYNTPINTYIWVVTNRKPKERRGKVQLVNGTSLFKTMDKSLGDKRKELTDDHIHNVTRLFAEFGEGPLVKVFNNEDFGFHRVRVERPLRVDFQANDDRISRLAEEKAWMNLLTTKKKGESGESEVAEGRRTQAELLRAIRRLDPAKVYLSRESWRKDFKAACKLEGASMPAILNKAIESALCERNEAASICMTNGQPEPDPDLRDYEHIPLKEDIHAYMKREVLPHVGDAWVDESATKVGYEIPFTRYFYEYVPPRPLSAITRDIRQLEGDIDGLLALVLA